MSQKQNNFGIVYVLTNPAMPGLVKIGMTTRDNLDARMKELYGTGVPVPFDCKYACKVKSSDCAKIEKALHTAFAPNRINANREFFQIKPEQVMAILELFNREDIHLHIINALFEHRSLVEFRITETVTDSYVQSVHRTAFAKSAMSFIALRIRCMSNPSPASRKVTVTFKSQFNLTLTQDIFQLQFLVSFYVWIGIKYTRKTGTAADSVPINLNILVIRIYFVQRLDIIQVESTQAVNDVRTPVGTS